MLCHIHYVHVSGIEPKFSGMVKEYSQKRILYLVSGSNLTPQKKPYYFLIELNVLTCFLLWGVVGVVILW